MHERQHATWGELLREAVEKPGRMLEAYTAVHNYSFGNALLALEQCIRRNLPLDYAFRFRTYWFVLAQTEGDDTPVPPIPDFDIDTALCALNITRTSFDELNGNIQGFAHGREIALNPVHTPAQNDVPRDRPHCSRAHRIGKAR
jgi:hypothetical protein